MTSTFGSGRDALAHCGIAGLFEEGRLADTYRLSLARFNAALNAVSNVDFRLGDLFEPVADESFDQGPPQ
jgi:hypothetical protein